MADFALAESYPFYLANRPEAPNQDLEVVDKYTGEVATRVAMADPAGAFASVVTSSVPWNPSAGAVGMASTSSASGAPSGAATRGSDVSGESHAPLGSRSSSAPARDGFVGTIAMSSTLSGSVP